MLSTNLTNQFGKIFANILREFIRFDGVISRDTTYMRAGYMKCCAREIDNGEPLLLSSFSNSSIMNYNNNNNNVASTTSCANINTTSRSSIDNNVQLLPEKQRYYNNNKNNSKHKKYCPFSGKLETSLPSSAFRLANVWTPPTDLKILNREFEPERTLNDEIKAQKRFLNATTNSAVHIQKTLINATSPLPSPPPTIKTITTRITTKSFLRAMSMFSTRPIIPILPRTLDEPTATTFKMTRRWFHPKANNRSNCAEWCGEDPCNLNRKSTHLKKSMWLAPDCYDKCPKPYRYDIVFMPGSNKETREYQQTWIECPPIRIVKKPVCCFEPKCLPPICRRPRKVPKSTPGKHDTCGVNICRGEVHHPDCEKVREPCCAVKARDPPCCKIYPTPSCCQKRCTPYPSFSECCRPESNRKRPVECLCLVRPTMCEVWADWRKKYLPGQYEDH